MNKRKLLRQTLAGSKNMGGSLTSSYLLKHLVSTLCGRVGAITFLIIPV